MSVHSAKGLEFQTVFITGLEEGLFPHDNSRNEADGLEEERRLMYVAITRARRQLYLTHAQQRMLHGQIRFNLPSQFLQEIPENLVRSFSFRTAKPAPAPAPVRVANTRAENYHPRPVPRREASLPFKVGSRVNHPKYGEGVVAAYQGQGADSEIKVIFPKIGDKWFILEYARLSALA